MRMQKNLANHIKFGASVLVSSIARLRSASSSSPSIEYIVPDSKHIIVHSAVIKTIYAASIPNKRKKSEIVKRY